MGQAGCGSSSSSKNARNTNHNCYLKNAKIDQNICLNILTSRRKNDHAISGFNCFLGGGDRKCWSTNNSINFCTFRFEASDADDTVHNSGKVKKPNLIFFTLF